MCRGGLVCLDFSSGEKHSCCFLLSGSPSPHGGSTPWRNLLPFCEMIMSDFSLGFSTLACLGLDFFVGFRSLVCAGIEAQIIKKSFLPFSCIYCSSCDFAGTSACLVLFLPLAMSPLKLQIFTHNLINVFGC